MATKTTAPPKNRAKKPTRNGRPKKLKQQYIPGCEPPSIPEIDRLADRYREARDERMRLTEEEVNSADLLEAAMKKHNLTAYEYEGYVVRINRVEKVQVKKKTPAEFVHDAAAKREAADAE